MKPSRSLLGAGMLTLMLTILSSEAAPNNNQSQLFAKGIPFTLQDLPPGRVKAKIESLPGPAQQRAMQWLHSFSFAEEDLTYIQVDDLGAVYYEDSYLPDAFEQTESSSSESSEPVIENITATQLFSLHSNYGSSKVVIVDFDGHIISGTAWNNIGGVAATLNALPYDRDGSPYTYSQSELDEMAEIWSRIAEDFAPYDIDVTTEDPGFTNSTTGRILITKNVDANGNSMPHSSAGGVAYVNVWGRSNYHTYYSPALVYYNNLGGGWPPYVAEAASHELGHNLALSHDGTNSVSYYSGHGTGYVSWGAIMGVGYYTQVTQWSKGEYTGANQPQDDLAIIDGFLGYRVDDHSNTSAAASALTVEADGSILATNPESDPLNTYTTNKGVIEDRNDTDYFWFNAEAGEVDLTVTPAWAAYYRGTRRGANLDIQAALYDISGTLLAQDDPLDETDADLTATVGAGTYYLAVTGVGNTISPYSDYGSLGQYFISGSITPSESSNSSPIANNDSAIGTEDNNVAIQVLNNDSDPDSDPLSISSVSSANNGSAVINGSAITYTPNANFNGSDSFSYTISDGKGGSDSATVNITVSAVNDNPVAVNDADSTDEAVATNISVITNDSDVDGDSLAVTSTSQGSNGSVTVNGTTVTYTPNGSFIGVDSFSYTVSDGNGGSDSATVQVTVSAVAILPADPSSPAVGDGANGTANIYWIEGTGGGDEDGFEVQRETKHKKRNTWQGTSIVGSTAENITSYDDASGTGTYRYRVRAFNVAGFSNWSGWTIVTVTSSSGGGGNGGGNGGGKNKNR